MNRLRPLLIFGTRPEAIKMAPVVQACGRRSAEIAPIICVTGQHREMLRQVTDYFGITPDLELDVMTVNQTLARLTSRCVDGIDGALSDLKPDCVVAQGDTTTVMAAAMTAFYRRIPFVHVEAGLRTGNLQSPWPEELNRRIAALTTAVHCAPTVRSARHLLQEGISRNRIHVTGNTVIDALLWTVERERRRSEWWNQKYVELQDAPMVLITGHRRENFGAGLESICRAISHLAGRFPEVQFVFPVHLNPNVQGPVHAALSHHQNIHLRPPASYPEFVWLMDRATVLLTDSGGVQEEAPSLRKPVLVMRETTERPEAVEFGAVELVGTQFERIVDGVANLLTDPVEYAARQLDENPYGDGHAAERIVELLIRRAWDVSEEMDCEFSPAETVAAAEPAVRHQPVIGAALA